MKILSLLLWKAPFIFIVEVLSLFITPIATLFVRWDTELSDKPTGRNSTIRGDLPASLWWLGTPDERLPGDLNIAAVKSWLTLTPWATVNRWWCSTRWLWRNRVYGLSIWLGEPIDWATPFVERGVRCRTTPYVGGWWLAQKDGLFEFAVVWPWTSAHCAELRVGWKLRPAYELHDLQLDDQTFIAVPIYPSLRPWKSRT